MKHRCMFLLASLVLGMRHAQAFMPFRKFRSLIKVITRTMVRLFICFICFWVRLSPGCLAWLRRVTIEVVVVVY